MPEVLSTVYGIEVLVFSHRVPSNLFQKLLYIFERRKRLE